MTGWSLRAWCVIVIDQDQARLLGPELRFGRRRAINSDDQRHVTVTQLRDDIYLVNVVVRATDG